MFLVSMENTTPVYLIKIRVIKFFYIFHCWDTEMIKLCEVVKVGI